MRLDIALMHRLGGVLALDDDVGVLEAGLGVALLEGHDLGDVRRLGRLRIDAGGEHVVVQNGCVVGHRRFDVDDERQHVVLHVDQRQRLIGDRLRGGGDGGDGMAFVQRLAARHDVAGQIAEVHRTFADERLFVGDVREVLRGHDGEHARQRFRLRRVDRDDLRVRVRRAQDLAPQHAGGAGIGGEHRAAGDLVDAVGTDGTRADDFQVGVDVVHQEASPRMTAAASITARMTLS